MNKFIVVSIAIHLAVYGCITLISEKEEAPPKIVEISFGSGNSAGGSSPKISQGQTAKPTKTEVPKVVKQLKSLSKSAIDTPAISSTVTDKVSQKSAAVAPVAEQGGNGIGTGGIGNGTGYGSGDGAGINDSMVKYRGLIHKLVNQKKKYPATARRMNHEGKVLVQVKLSKEGKLLDVEMVQESRYESLNKASLEAIKDIDKYPDIPSESGLNEISLRIPFEYESVNGDMI